MEEDCRICGTTVPFSVTTHVMLNPSGEDGVSDCYVCQNCYEEHLEPLFAVDEDEGGPADVEDER